MKSLLIIVIFFFSSFCYASFGFFFEQSFSKNQEQLQSLGFSYGNPNMRFYLSYGEDLSSKMSSINWSKNLMVGAGTGLGVAAITKNTQKSLAGFVSGFLGSLIAGLGAGATRSLEYSSITEGVLGLKYHVYAHRQFGYSLNLSSGWYKNAQTQKGILEKYDFIDFRGHLGVFYNLKVVHFYLELGFISPFGSEHKSSLEAQTGVEFLL